MIYGVKAGAQKAIGIRCVTLPPFAANCKGAKMIHRRYKFVDRWGRKHYCTRYQAMDTLMLWKEWKGNDHQSLKALADLDESGAQEGLMEGKLYSEEKPLPFWIQSYEFTTDQEGTLIGKHHEEYGVGGMFGNSNRIKFKGENTPSIFVKILQSLFSGNWRKGQKEIDELIENEGEDTRVWPV